MNLHPQRLDVICAVRPFCQISKVQLDVVPAIVEFQRHRADIWLHPCDRLKIWCSKSTSDILVIQNLDLKREVFLKIFHNNSQKWKLNPKSSRRISWACDVSWLYICSNNFKYIRLDIFILGSFNVPIHNFLIPYLQWLGPEAIKNGQEPRLKCILEHVLKLVDQLNWGSNRRG